MKQVIEHYGDAILTGMVFVALGAILVGVLASDGYVATEFKTAMATFFGQLNGLA